MILLILSTTTSPNQFHIYRLQFAVTLPVAPPLPVYSCVCVSQRQAQVVVPWSEWLAGVKSDEALWRMHLFTCIPPKTFQASSLMTCIREDAWNIFFGRGVCRWTNASSSHVAFINKPQELSVSYWKGSGEFQHDVVTWCHHVISFCLAKDDLNFVHISHGG